MNFPTNLDRITANRLKPLDDRLFNSIFTKPLKPRARARLYQLATAKGYSFAKDTSSIGRKRQLACICSTPFSPHNVDMDKQTVTPSCANLRCIHYGGRNYATIRIADALKTGDAFWAYVDVDLSTVKVWKA
jgi:hypothetical protein